jgi:hypothetical protein
MSSYLSGVYSRDDPLTEYFSLYRIEKLKNKPVKAIGCAVNTDSYNTRYSILSEEVEDGSIVLWVDGMGIEWLPLLLDELTNRVAQAKVRHKVSRAILPTETEYNNQWDKMPYLFKKINRLDELNHKGLPDDNDYYSCINRQFEIISEVASEANNLLRNYDRVIITGDHGSSRLAALAFHATAGITAPSKAKVRSFGRFCEIESPTDLDHSPLNMVHASVGDKHFLVLADYEHYSVSGNVAGGNTIEDAVAGEVHGGGTPEEYLVPVVIVESGNEKKRLLLDYEITDSRVFSERNRVTIKLRFNNSISSLEVKTGDTIGIAEEGENNTWSIVFTSLSEGEYVVDVIANNHILNKKEKFTVKIKGTTVHDPFGDM